MVLTLERLQTNKKFIDLIVSLKKKGGRVFLYAGMVRNRKSSNDIDLYVEGIPYRELPQGIYIEGLPVNFGLMIPENSPRFEL